MRDCADRRDFITRNSSDLFQNMLQTSLAEIRHDLFSNADFVKPAQEKTITKIHNGSTYQVVTPANQRVVVLSDTEMILNGANSIDDKGFYDWDSGKILLNQNWLCVETFYHETLHSVSIASVRTDVNYYFRFFYEGLTECLTGYLLLKNYNSCYNNCWRKKSNTACQYTYPQQTRIWASFFNCIDIQEIVPIYFYNSSNDWESLCDSWIGRIREINNSNFTNIFQETRTVSIMDVFDEECRNQFGSKYEQAFDSNRSTIDLIKLIK